MFLKNVLLLGAFGAAAVFAARAMRPRPARQPAPADVFRALMSEPEPTPPVVLRDPAYGLVRRARDYHLPFSPN